MIMLRHMWNVIDKVVSEILWQAFLDDNPQVAQLLVDSK